MLFRQITILLSFLFFFPALIWGAEEDVGVLEAINFVGANEDTGVWSFRDMVPEN